MAATNKAPLFDTNISKDQCKDTGMAMVLILLLVGYFLENTLFYHVAIFALLINMIIPKIYYPVAILWFGLSNILGAVMSKVILTIVFFVVVVPIGFLRKIAGKDPMKLKPWKKDDQSVMKVRNHTFTAKDLEKPY